jgi:pimeloyl-ACP methyl ester carboxylesterase
MERDTACALAHCPVGLGNPSSLERDAAGPHLEEACPMNDVIENESTTASVAGIELELFDRGNGPPILFLHGAGGVAANDPFVALLAKQRRVVAPSHPGFGRSPLPDWIDSVDDIAHVHLELLDRLGLREVDLIGASIGGWIAAEMATKTPERFSRLVLIGPVGVKTGPVDKLDVPDIFAMAQDKLAPLLYHDPAKARPDMKALGDEQIAIMARNRETLALLAWEPYMHNPKLKHRLHRVAAPTLFVRGESDGLVSPTYLERYARLLPHARTTTIAQAGHAPHAEQPQATATIVLDFLGAKR